MAVPKARSAWYSTKVDIFSTGLICWEMWHRELPFSSFQSRHIIKVEQLIREGVRPAIEPDTPPGLVSLIKRCWATDPEGRLTAAEALEHVMRDGLLDPMTLDDPTPDDVCM